jgi:uncharacterized protein GlcG (DUF336 family)
MRRIPGVERCLAALAAALVAACGGGGSGASSVVTAPPTASLTPADVQRVIAQAAAEAQARNAHAHIAVVDRVGNVLAVFRMTGAPETVAIASGLGVTGGLDGIAAGTVPASQAAITKAITGAFLSSRGNAFSSRTASQIVQMHFNPDEQQQPSGPLYGVQFSQLTCSDVMRNTTHGNIGPKRSPLGLAGDAGGLPLYKDGALVGGIGIESDGLYSIDLDPTDIDENVEELVAVAGASGFFAPADIRGERITADGRTFRFVDSEAIRSNPAQAPAFASLPGALEAVAGYVDASVHAGTVFGEAASGIRPASAAADAPWILVDAANANRFPARAATDGAMSAAEVAAMLAEGAATANRARAQIRRPLGGAAQVTIAVVDRNGEILGLVRTGDGPVFGIDVAVQKARSAMFFSHPAAASELRSAGQGAYVDATRAFLADPAAFTGTIAWTARAIGNVHRPTFPDGIAGTPAGPLSTPIASWSPFNVGLQLDLSLARILAGVGGDLSQNCTGLARLRNGAQIFPGGVPIYRGATLVGGIGVSGDGVDQDDMVAALALANAGRASGLGHAPAAMRSDSLTPRGVRLRYVQCPQSPFNDSSEQNVCAGL